MSKITSTINIPQADIFGRIGTGFGQGLAESMPKEIERARLASHLQQLGQQTNNTPWQNFTGLVSAPGITPQMIQSGENLIRRTGIARGFGAPGRFEGQTGQDVNASPVGGMQPPGVNNVIVNPQQGQPMGGARGGASPETVSTTEQGQPQINPRNPLSPELQPKNRWTPQQWQNRYAQNLQKHEYMDTQQVKQLTDEEEARELAQPEGEQAKQQSLRGTEDRLKEQFRERLGLKLHKQVNPKTGIDETLDQVSGPAQNNLIRGMARDIIEHPNKSEEDVVNDWSEKGFLLAKAKKQLQSRAGRSHADLNILFNKDDYRTDIEEDAKAYKRSGNSRELYNDLQSMYGFSPMGSAYLAFDRTPQVKQYIKEWDPKHLPKGVQGPEAPIWRAQKVAMDMENLIKDDDSILAIAKSLKYKYPDFDTGTFFRHFKDNSDRLGLTPEQKLELSQGTQISGNWADLLVLPWSGGKP